MSEDDWFDKDATPCERAGHPDEGDGVCACGLAVFVAVPLESPSNKKENEQ